MCHDVALEEVLRPGKLSCVDRSCHLIRLLHKDSNELVGVLREGGSVEGEKSSVAVNGLAAGGRLHEPVLVENLLVEAGVHTLSWPAGREGAAAAHHHLQNRCCREGVVGPVYRFEAEGHMGHAVTLHPEVPDISGLVLGLDWGDLLTADSSEVLLHRFDDLVMVTADNRDDNVGCGVMLVEERLDALSSDGLDDWLRRGRWEGERSVDVRSSMTVVRDDSFVDKSFPPFALLDKHALSCVDVPSVQLWVGDSLSENLKHR
mmetsp:Transcript_4462/g.10508  ORF Transcript_4462/g.10508 Transcript_4462/m.10508 type:complete len:261 (+) Transcript_4462:479-1261(+)